MKNFIVLYRIKSIMSPLEQPFGFQCWADDADHAEEQAQNAYPDADIVWVWQGPHGIGMEAALNDYYTSDEIKCHHCGEVTNIGGLIGPTTNDCPRCGQQALYPMPTEASKTNQEPQT